MRIFRFLLSTWRSYGTLTVRRPADSVSSRQAMISSQRWRTPRFRLGVLMGVPSGTIIRRHRNQNVEYGHDYPALQSARSRSGGSLSVPPRRSNCRRRVAARDDPAGPIRRVRIDNYFVTLTRPWRARTMTHLQTAARRTLLRPSTQPRLHKGPDWPVVDSLTNIILTN